MGRWEPALLSGRRYRDQVAYDMAVVEAEKEVTRVAESKGLDSGRLGHLFLHRG